jgi:hypothetical protein
MFSISDIKTFKEKGDEFGAELIKNVLYNGFCRKVFEKTIKLLAKTVTFRKISYKD